MTAPQRATGSPELAIDSMTIRGPRLAPAAAQDLAAAVAEALARQLSGRRRHLAAITVRIPASVLDARGAIDRTTIAQAVARAGQADA